MLLPAASILHTKRLVEPGNTAEYEICWWATQHIQDAATERCLAREIINQLTLINSAPMYWTSFRPPAVSKSLETPTKIRLHSVETKACPIRHGPPPPVDDALWAASSSVRAYDQWIQELRPLTT
ncbi:hypothetical protein AB1N83_009739 [Pleurotus pulmonarius]